MSSTLIPARTARTLLAAILVLGASLRVMALTKPFYVDEISTLTVASQSIAEMAGVMREIDASPALSPVLLHIWLKVSHADVWARLLPALFGIGVIWATFGLARELFGIRTGLWAALVVAIAPLHVEYAQYVRNYSLFTLLAVLQLWVFARCVVSETPASGRAVRDHLLLATLTAAMFYTHYLGFLVLVPEGVFALWRIRQTPRLVLSAGTAIIVGGLLFLPGLPLFVHNMKFDARRNLDRPAAPSVQKVLPDLFGELALGRRDLGFSDPTIRRAALATGLLLFPALLAVGMRAGLKKPFRQGTVLILMYVLLPVLVYVASGRTLVAARFFLPFGIAFLILVAHGLASLSLRASMVSAVMLSALCAIPLTHFVRDFSWSYDHRAVAQAIRGRWQPGDIILFVHPYEALHYQWYLGADWPMQGLTFTPLTEQTTYVIKPPPLQVDKAKTRALAAARAHDRLWIVGQSARSFTSRDVAEEREMLDWLDARLGRLDDLEGLTANDPVVRLYRGRPPADASPSGRPPEDREPRP